MNKNDYNEINQVKRDALAPLGELLVALRSLSNEEFAAVNRDLMDTKGESK